MRRDHKRRGIVLAWTAIMLIVMIGIVGLSIDWGHVVWDAHQLQDAADAAALAGALEVKTAFHDGTAGSYQRARALAMSNYAGGMPVDVCYNATMNDPNLDVVTGRYFISTKIFEPTVVGGIDVPNAVKVVTRHMAGWPVNVPLDLTFGPLCGVQTANVAKEAIAITVGGGGAALVCLDPKPTSVGLDLGGGGRVNVMAGSTPGEIYVNSFNPGGTNPYYAVMPGSQSDPDPVKGWDINCAGLSVCGVADPLIKEWYEGNGSYPVTQNIPVPMPDPLGSIPDLGAQPRATLVKEDVDGNVIATHDVGDPITNSVVLDFGAAEVDASGNPVLDPTTGKPYWTVAIDPGYWPGGIQLTNTAGGYTPKVKLNPGIYAFGGGPKAPGGASFINGAYVTNKASGLDLNGGVVEGFGVMAYLTKSDGATPVWAQVNQHGGSGTLRLTEIPLSDPSVYAGLVLFQDRSNPSEAFIGGGSANNILDGTLYFHSTGWNTLLHLQGGGGNVGIQVITDRLTIAGTALVTIAYDGRGFMPAIQSFLVK